jgi:uncharacterized surface protein with fasciclin (FAS1) repeats
MPRAFLLAASALAATAVVALSACSSSGEERISATPGAPIAENAPVLAQTPTTTAPTATTAPAQDIVATAAAAGQFNTLAAALTAAGLVETLQGAGPFTVFAPTDAAFAKVPAGTLNALLADKAALAKVLTYHVVPGRVLSTDIQPGPVTTVEGQPIQVAVEGGAVVLNGSAKVTTPDVLASNGVIHVIDSVLVPPGLQLPSTR